MTSDADYIREYYLIVDRLSDTEYNAQRDLYARAYRRGARDVKVKDRQLTLADIHAMSNEEVKLALRTNPERIRNALRRGI
jgi:hypothetical protein